MWLIKKIISEIISHSTSILFPDYCYLCKKATKKVSLCAACLTHMKKTIDTSGPFIKSIYSFKDPNVKKCIHAIKYFHRKDLVIPFAKILAEEIKLMTNYRDFILIPIPMPRYRKYLRGYNHTEILAKLLSLETAIPYKNNILIHNAKANKKRQVMTLSRKERLKNQKNSFLVSHNIKNMNIILIDDVTTTGATLHEARRVLDKAGAASIVAFTIAH